jgi:hypothetical protein
MMPAALSEAQTEHNATSTWGSKRIDQSMTWCSKVANEDAKDKEDHDDDDDEDAMTTTLL